MERIQNGPMRHDLANDRAARVTERAQARLTAGPLSSLRTISCSFQAGALTLTGDCPSYYHKQVAQVLVAGIDGVEQVDNRIEVRKRA